MYIKLGLYINGKWKYNSEKYSDVINPADESILEKLPHATGIENRAKFTSQELFLIFGGFRSK